MRHIRPSPLGEIRDRLRLYVGSGGSVVFRPGPGTWWLRFFTESRIQAVFTPQRRFGTFLPRRGITDSPEHGFHGITDSTGWHPRGEAAVPVAAVYAAAGVAGFWAAPCGEGGGGGAAQMRLCGSLVTIGYKNYCSNGGCHAARARSAK